MQDLLQRRLDAFAAAYKEQTEKRTQLVNELQAVDANLLSLRGAYDAMANLKAELETPPPQEPPDIGGPTDEEPVN